MTGDAQTVDLIRGNMNSGFHGVQIVGTTTGDYDGDGFQEVYWSKVDNTAYLRAVMHADGNIQYANYQNLDQMTDYLTGHGFADTVALIA